MKQLKLILPLLAVGIFTTMFVLITQAEPLAPPVDGDQICVSSTTQLNVPIDDTPIAGTYSWETFLDFFGKPPVIVNYDSGAWHITGGNFGDSHEYTSDAVENSVAGIVGATWTANGGWTAPLPVVTAGACGATAPEIDVQGNGQAIINGDTTPSVADDTDFGSTAVSGGTVAHTFTISNTGTVNLSLTSLSISDETHFSLTGFPSTPVGSGSSTTFEVTFNPTAAGYYTTTISIGSSDSDENPYTFVIGGTGAEVVAEADLRISQSIEFAFLDTIFIITAQNTGPDAADGAVVAVTPDAEIVVKSWTCVASGGAECPAASGDGDLPDQTVATFPNGGSVVYTLTTTVSGSHANVATITPPAGVTDPDMSNNTSTQMSAYLIILPIIYNNVSFSTP